MAAAVVDNRYIGRLRLQLLGFFMVAVLFYVSAIWYHPLTSKGGIHTFQFVRLSFPLPSAVVSYALVISTGPTRSPLSPRQLLSGTVSVVCLEVGAAKCKLSIEETNLTCITICDAGVLLLFFLGPVRTKLHDFLVGRRAVPHRGADHCPWYLSRCGQAWSPVGCSLVQLPGQAPPILAHCLLQCWRVCPILSAGVLSQHSVACSPSIHCSNLV